jgi:hypothetical protein
VEDDSPLIRSIESITPCIHMDVRRESFRGTADCPSEVCLVAVSLDHVCLFHLLTMKAVELHGSGQDKILYSER